MNVGIVDVKFTGTHYPIICFINTFKSKAGSLNTRSTSLSVTDLPFTANLTGGFSAVVFDILFNISSFFRAGLIFLTSLTVSVNELSSRELSCNGSLF